ncbi:EAL domain-containing protein [Achromobacter sp. GG226]|uniref:EAL domain-containing protein n=1 Tax=Verticiella alkaliphila TaxID=2779529 RepID=UPI001C0BAD57|nr:EAL domain-containing protein [Verticiella sp. GG226]MBU4610996.1 EAL domain-containing protein [Verticiella sp. GG226]
MTNGAVVEQAGRRYETVCTLSGCLFITVRRPAPLYTSPLFLGLLAAGALVGLGLGLIVDGAVARLRAPGRQLRKALTAGDLEVVYQPIVRIADRQRVGAEALLRWRDAQGRTISPEVFVPIAEQDGFVSELTRFVVRRVLDDLATALVENIGFKVSVNISASDLLDTGFARFVARELQRRGLNPACLGFEITERSTAARAAMAQGIQRLRQAGHGVFIDDFGVDYSSLSYLSQLQVDGIKLDRSFITALGDDHTANIVPQIVQMGQVLGVALVAEGVETDGQAAYLASLDPNLLGQGWLFSRPLPADQLFS